jgi:hypothetical protein
MTPMPGNFSGCSMSVSARCGSTPVAIGMGTYGEPLKHAGDGGAPAVPQSIVLPQSRSNG